MSGSGWVWARRQPYRSEPQKCELIGHVHSFPRVLFRRYLFFRVKEFGGHSRFMGWEPTQAPNPKGQAEVSARPEGYSRLPMPA
jgi:hypothetical protein